MTQAQIRLEAGQKITLEGISYIVAPHPALPGLPYVQRGARGFVIQLRKSDGERMALKYFKIKYRVPALVPITEALRRHADLPGLKAARRTVFTRERHPDVLSKFPALEYGVLMPWLPGLTWYDVITAKTPISAEQGIMWARQTCRVLAGLEAQNLAHCDIAGVNVMVDRAGGGVELVDIEEMYGAEMPRPVEFPGGQDGYQHRASRQQGQWMSEGDRFGAAVLIAEMLGWSHARIRQNSADEHFFAAAEVQDPNSARFRLLSDLLHSAYSPTLADCFRQAWQSRTLSECPTLAAWAQALEGISLPASPPEKDTQPAAGAAPVTHPSQVPASGNGVVTRQREIKVQMPVTPFGVEGAESPSKAETEASVSLVQSSPASAPTITTPIIPTPETLDLEGKKLCRNCGAINDARSPFCGRCGFYIGTGIRKPMPPATHPGVPAGTKTGAHAAGGAPPQPVALNRQSDQVITARRVGADGRRIETPRPPTEPSVEGNFGQWIVLAIILGALLTIILIALIQR